jgi:uncharacterized protein YjbI with pentapeptide repeats
MVSAGDPQVTERVSIGPDRKAWRLRAGWCLVVTLFVAVVLSGCATSEESAIGACVIRPGSNCAGNYMTGSRLSYADLFDANLDHADLTGVDLSWSNLTGATIRGAQVVHGDLRGAQLSYADLADANLEGTKLDGAVLAFANLYGANLAGASLVDVTWCQTVMPDGSIAAPDC